MNEPVMLTALLIDVPVDSPVTLINAFRVPGDESDLFSRLWKEQRPHHGSPAGVRPRRDVPLPGRRRRAALHQRRRVGEWERAGRLSRTSLNFGGGPRDRQAAITLSS